jgi:ribosomal-protein-alanine N-acetyltransferase
MTFKIRLMQDSDTEAVYEIERSAHVTPWSKEIIRDCIVIGYDCRVIELYEQHKKLVVGYTIARHHRSTYHLLNLCIEKTRQSQGLGKKLLQSVLNSLGPDNRIDYVTLEVRLGNEAALQLYKSMGFQQEEIKKDYYNDRDGKEDAVVLKKYL